MAGQPYFKLLDEPDPNAVAMFELSPALFISGAAKMHGLDIDENKTCRFNVRPVWRLVQLTDGSWYKKADIDLKRQLVKLKSGPGYHWYDVHQSRKKQWDTNIAEDTCDTWQGKNLLLTTSNFPQSSWMGTSAQP